MTFGYIGAQQTEKGVPLLIHAFNEIEDGQLFIYGSGGSQMYQNIVRNHNIHFGGAINDNQKQEIFLN